MNTRPITTTKEYRVLLTHQPLQTQAGGGAQPSSGRRRMSFVWDSNILSHYLEDHPSCWKISQKFHVSTSCFQSWLWPNNSEAEPMRSSKQSPRSLPE